jgi:methylenetetrahydrofolate reductase (NADPH)
MKITELLRHASERHEPVFSFEFFPPKTEAGVEALFQSIAALRPLAPGFVSVTWGAGGTVGGRSLEIVSRIEKEAELTAMAHLTCSGVSAEELKATLEAFRGAGIDNVLLLRGDPPRGQRTFSPHPGGFAFANELVALAKSLEGKPLCIGAACYPEGHVEQRDRLSDLKNLKQKVDAGAQFLITQLFFDNRAYFEFVDRARAAGITAPIIPGIMPITNVDQVERFTAMCGASVPPALHAAMKVRREDPDAALQLGVAWATLQCADLLRRGAPGIHFYTLNRSPATRAILAALRAMEPWRG